MSVTQGTATADPSAGPPLEVVRLGHPVLRSIAEPVPDEWFGTGRLADLARDLVHTMLTSDGVGLAAPQVAEPLRLFAYWVPALGDEPEIAPSVLVNPELRAIGEETEEGSRPTRSTLASSNTSTTTSTVSCSSIAWRPHSRSPSRKSGIVMSSARSRTTTDIAEPSRPSTPITLSAVALLLAAALGLVVGMSDIANTSIGWHLASGRLVLDHHAVPRADPFSFTAEGREWIDHEWLFQVLTEVAHRIGGEPLLVVLRALFVAALSVLMFLLARRGGLDPPGALILAALCLYGARIRFFLRPELATLLIVPSVVWVFLNRRSERHWLLKLAILMALGANLHAGVLVAPPLLAFMLIGEWLRSRLAPQEEAPTLVSGVLGLAVASTAPLLNPYGWKLYTVPLKIAQLVGLPQIPNPEWISPLPADVPPLYVALAAGLLVLAARERDPTRWLLFVISSLLALRYVRNVGLYFALLPIAVAPALARLTTERRRHRPGAATAAAATVAAVVALSVVVAPRYHLGFSFSESFYPHRACGFMEREGLLADPIYNDVRFGGYLINRYSPDRRVFLDDRNEIHEPLLSEIYRLLQTSDQAGWQSMLDRYGVTAALVRYNQPFRVVSPTGEFVESRGFSALWFPANGWALLYWDDTAMVLAKRSAADPGLLDRCEFRMIRPDDLEHLERRLATDPEIRPAVAAELARTLEDQPDNRRALALSEFLLSLQAAR
jgi:hypothetical protein